jgi:hypothetical protein
MPLSPGTEGYLAAVEAACSRMTWLGGQEEAGGCSFMTAILRYTFLLQRDQPGRQMAAVPFAVLLPGPVLSGIREQQPLALCLVAGYATVLHALRRHLWIQGWGRRVMEGVERKLAGSEWEEVIAWPVQVVLSNPSE